jgi:hypothetical protein
MSTPIEFISSSQAAQDAWVFATLAQLRTGFFVDLGCSHPFEINNTWALERIGWRGLLVDTDHDAVAQCMRHRDIGGDGRVIAHRADLTQPHDFWDWVPPTIDYLSLDIDDRTFDALQLIPHDRVRFRCATIEHDTYRLGPAMRDAMRSYLQQLGYTLARADVEHEGYSFEDWWVREELLP